MEKIDLKKVNKVAYTGKSEPQIVTIPPMKYVLVSGKGDPNNSEEFEQAVGVIYALAYTMKFESKKKERDFVVAPMEGQWWAEDLNDFKDANRDNWLWNLMIALPDHIDKEDFENAKSIVKRKKNPSGLEKAKFEVMEDGTVVQVKYIGPYSEEAATIAGMHHYAEERGYRLRGRHREVYLSDPRKTDPGKLKTIIRHPVETN